MQIKRDIHRDGIIQSVIKAVFRAADEAVG